MRIQKRVSRYKERNLARCLKNRCCEIKFNSDNTPEDAVIYNETKIMDRTKRCLVCGLGFPKVGSLTSEMRLQQHKNTPHRSQCLECGLFFVSDAHVKYHIGYVHDNKCLHCHSYCESNCSEKYGLTIESAGSEEMETGQIEKITAVEDAEVGLEELVEGLTTNHLDDVQNMAMSIYTGYTDFEAEKWCKLSYFPSPMIPERNVSRKVLW